MYIWLDVRLQYQFLEDEGMMLLLFAPCSPFSVARDIKHLLIVNSHGVMVLAEIGRQGVEYGITLSSAGTDLDGDATSTQGAARQYTRAETAGLWERTESRAHILSSHCKCRIHQILPLSSAHPLRPPSKTINVRCTVSVL